MIQVPKRWVYSIVLICLFLTIPTFIYRDDALEHWLLHLMSLSASKLFLPCLLIYILQVNLVTVKEFFLNYSGLFVFTVLCFLYFPTYIADLRFIDKYDWFTVPTKTFVWSISFGLTLINIWNYKDD